MTRVIGKTPLCGLYYPAVCTQCGWVGSSEDGLGEDADCPECQGNTDMLEVERAFALLQEQALEHQAAAKRAQGFGKIAGAIEVLSALDEVGPDDSGHARAQALITAQHAGIEAAALLVDKRCTDYIEEHGSYDPATGVVELPGTGEEYVGDLMEIADQIRASAVPGASVAKPNDLESRLSRAMEVIAALREQLGGLTGAISSINKGPAHEISIAGDDQPCYWQRKEWIDYVLGLCAQASPAVRGFDPARPGSDVSCRIDAKRLADGTLFVENLTYGPAHD